MSILEVVYARANTRDEWLVYELGLRTSTVSTYLAAACRKLRVTSRVELIRAMAAIEHKGAS